MVKGTGRIQRNKGVVHLSIQNPIVQGISQLTSGFQRTRCGKDPKKTSPNLIFFDPQKLWIRTSKKEWTRRVSVRKKRHMWIRRGGRRANRGKGRKGVWCMEEGEGIAAWGWYSIWPLSVSDCRVVTAWGWYSDSASAAVGERTRFAWGCDGRNRSVCWRSVERVGSAVKSFENPPGGGGPTHSPFLS